jgi:hypothetical protein
MDKIKVSSKNLEDVLMTDLSSVSEIIAIYIIDKILSYVQTEIEVKVVDSLIPSFCTEFSEKLLSDALIFEHLFYDLHDKNKEFKKDKYFNGQYYGEDDWSFIKEPVYIYLKRNVQ